LLPSGTTLPAAAGGFENEGQFIAALHIAHNLNIPFDQLKSQMTGKNEMSLGKAIQKLRPDVDSKTLKDNVKLADRQAERDIQQASSGTKQNRFVSRLTSDTNLSARLTALLPSGTTLSDAATGFKNEGQFIASLHAAKNLNIPFAELKDRVTAGESLGAAIHELKPNLDAKSSDSAAVEAEGQAKNDKLETSASASASANAQVNTK
jgi:TPP-dependent 2-oxoacid decarboxylase